MDDKIMVYSTVQIEKQGRFTLIYTITSNHIYCTSKFINNVLHYSQLLNQIIFFLLKRELHEIYSHYFWGLINLIRSVY